jgi:ubiquinone/menaquinone biosynthesis C-methylase UbiE
MSPTTNSTNSTNSTGSTTKSAPATRRFAAMEGFVARWYARVRGTENQLTAWRAQAAEITAGLPDDAAVLEVAPGPGYLAVEIARLRRFTVTGLDISRTFVEIAAGNAARAGVDVRFRRGDAAAMPFDAESFDLIICQAAFKNFARPAEAIGEMHRVLRTGGTAVIQDMHKGATAADIAGEVRGMELGRLNAFMTRRALAGLRRRAYTRAEFERLAAGGPFPAFDIKTEGISIEVRLTKAAG